MRSARTIGSGYAGVRAARCLAALLLVALGTGGLATQARAAFPGAPGPIAYSKVELDEGENPGGLYAHGPRQRQTPRRLTDDFADSNPSYSANGRLIVFEGRRDPAGGTQIYVMRSNGTNVRPLTRGGNFDSNPSFSPDGKRVVFDRALPGSNRTSHIYIVNVDGTGLRQLTRGPRSDQDPVFTPNGRRIVFVSERDRDASTDRGDIFAMSRDGTQIRQLIDGPRKELEPDTSPDGRRLAFVSNRNSGINIFVARIDGQRIRQLTGSRRSCFSGACYKHPSWAPDGKHIAYLTEGRYNSDLEVMRPDGTGAKEFDGAGTETEGFGSKIGAPGWGPWPR